MFLRRNKACNLFFRNSKCSFSRSVYPVVQPLHPFVTLEAVLRGCLPELSPLGLVASNAFPSQLAADRAVCGAKHCCDLSLGFCRHTQGRNLGTLCLGQVVGTFITASLWSVKPPVRVPADGPLPLYWFTQNACSYYLNSRIEEVCQVN